MQFHQIIHDALQTLTEELRPVIETRLEQVYGNTWKEQAVSGFRDHRNQLAVGDEIEWDAQMLLTVMWDHWNPLFRGRLGHIERSLVSELREFRNQWAHQKPMEFDDTYRMLDSIERLLRAVSRFHAATGIGIVKDRLLKQKSEVTDDERTTEEPAQVERTPVVSVERESDWQFVFLSLICCAFILGQIYLSWNTNGWLMMSLVVFVFGFLIFRRMSRTWGSVSRG